MNHSFRKTSPPEIENIEIVELLGEGGMGLVYKARQILINRTVAVKVMSNVALRDEDEFRRFQKEAIFSSTVEHPNIVKTLSTGVSMDGQPYLVMEYVSGVSLADELKNNGRLTLQKFRDVFLPSLAALKQAHQAGLIHRDVKPSNIMICKNDAGLETVKLLDFGLAKLSAEGEQQNEKLTMTGQVMGTPCYMSPEQCQLQPLDGRSDLYSISCVMYEALVGEPPFSGESGFEIMHKHCKVPTPSAGDLMGRIEIPRELANAILSGLAKDPASRPQTASEFAERLDLVLGSITLDKVPSLKDPGQLSANTHVRRWIIAASVLVSALVLCGVINVQNIHRQSEALGIEHASLESRWSQTEEETIRDHLRTLAAAEKEYGPNDLSVAGELIDMAEVYRHCRKEKEAKSLFKRALAIREKKLGANDLTVAASLVNLGSFYLGQCNSAKAAEAKALLKRALTIQEQDPHPDDVASTSVYLGWCYLWQKDIPKAEQLFNKALEIQEKVPGLNHKFETGTLDALASLRLCQNKYKEAEQLFKHEIEMHERTMDKNSILIADSIVCLAGCYQAQGDYAAAKPLLKRALDIEKAVGPDLRNLALIWKNKASLFHMYEKYAVAEPLYELSNHIVEEELGQNSPQLACSHLMLADCCQQQGKIAQADVLVERCLAIKWEYSAEDCEPLTWVETLKRLAESADKRGKSGEAEELRKRARAMQSTLNH